MKAHITINKYTCDTLFIVIGIPIKLKSIEVLHRSK